MALLVAIFNFKPSAFVAPPHSGHLSIVIEEVKSDEGNILVSLHHISGAFPGDHTKALKNERIVAKKGQVRLVLKDVPYGTYAVSVLHDKNSNNKMDLSLFNIPKESFGFSNDAIGFMSPPSFNDASFIFSENNQSITIHLR